ncbi:AGAP009825-PA-like protein [Anopheles sinensis]|uniref:AGAP009825-PA-like protein n=1 Tax=Anopheles sinensis TaxID=74873 RepID=A0A084WG32_ANOSI|nr:AGAP009825-PA-like protein [Anopheles sinensis]
MSLYKCPFDPLHQISANSFAKHLTKCQRQHPDVKYARCPLNSFHLMKPEELHEHVRTCPSRAQFDAYKYSFTGASSAPVEEIIINTGSPPGVTSFASASAGSLQDDDECWDDFNYAAYNPLENCKQKKGQHKNFMTPCANKFVVPNASVSMIKQELQNDGAPELQTVKEEPLSEGTQSPARSFEAESTVEEEKWEIKSEYPERRDQPTFRERADDGRTSRSSANSYKDFERRNEDNASHRGQSDRGHVPSYSHSTYGDTYMGRYDRNRHAGRRSYEEDRQKYRPYHNPYSRNSKMSKDPEDRYQSSRHYRGDRGNR